MQLLISVVILRIYASLVFANVAITKINVRMPKEDDIGLIFDICISNPDSESKELQEFLIRPDGGCFVNISCTQVMPNAGRIVGGNFGTIESGSVETVSLIWPTISLYNRVGYCPIVLSTSNSRNEQSCKKQVVHFDTRFEILDPDGHIFRKRKEFMDCNNWDKEYFKNCSPVNCQERYFGKRSFFNCITQHCEEAARCAKPYEVYDEYANECINTKRECDDRDIEQIRRGKFEEHVLNLRAAYTQPSTPAAFNEEFDEQPDVNEEPESELKHNVIREADDIESTDSAIPYWLQGLADGLLIVFATIAIYVLICFIIFLIVSWLSRRQSHSGSNITCVITPTSSEGNIQLFTHSSLMSQR